MALDEPKEEDRTKEEQGYTFCMNPALLEQVRGVTVDFGYMGFSIEPLVPLNTGGSGCSACSVAGGCGPTQ